MMPLTASPSIPEAVQLLSLFPVDVSTLYKEPTAPARPNLRFRRLCDVQKLVDALAFFLPAQPDASFAISLSLGEKIVLYAAGNSTLDVESAQVSLQAIWSAMLTLSATRPYCLEDKEQRTPALNSILKHTLSARHDYIERQFRRHRASFDAFCKLYSATNLDRYTSHWETTTIKDYVDSATFIFQATMTFCESQSEEREVALFRELQTQQMRMGRGKRLCATQRQQLKEIQDEAGITDPQFDFSKYVEDLWSPILHLLNIIGIANFKLRDYAHLPLEITTIVPSPVDYSDRLNSEIPLRDRLATFLHASYDPSPWDEKRGVSATEEGIHQAVDNALGGCTESDHRSTTNFPIAASFKSTSRAPHPEVVLLQYHAIFPSSNPYPYIGISDSSSSCFQARLCLDACNSYASRQEDGLLLPWFALKAIEDHDSSSFSSWDAPPRLMDVESTFPLPVFPGDMGGFIESYMRSSLRKIATEIITTEINNLAIRRWTPMNWKFTSELNFQMAIDSDEDDNMDLDDELEVELELKPEDFYESP